MSSKLKPNNNNKKKQQTAQRTRIWTIALCIAVLVIATILILIRMGVFDSDDPDVVGNYELTHMTDPTTGVTTPVEQMKSAMEMVGPGEALISIELHEDGTFSFDPNFDLMVRFVGTYKVDGNTISMSADDDDSGEITGTISSRSMTITDQEGYKMTFQKVK